MTQVRPYQVSWWDDPLIDFDLSSPWWQTDARLIRVDENTQARQYSVVAAVMASSPDHAKSHIIDAYAYDVELEWLAIREQPLGWSPFNEDRRRENWMIWNQRPH